MGRVCAQWLFGLLNNENNWSHVSVFVDKDRTPPIQVWVSESMSKDKIDWLELKPVEGREFKIEDFTCILVKPLPELDSEKAEYFREFWEEVKK